MSLLQLDLTQHCLLLFYDRKVLGLGVISLYIVSANQLLTKIAVSILSLHFLELFSFSTHLLCFYKLEQNLRHSECLVSFKALCNKA